MHFLGILFPFLCIKFFYFSVQYEREPSGIERKIDIDRRSREWAYVGKEGRRESWRQREKCNYKLQQ